MLLIYLFKCRKGLTPAREPHMAKLTIISTKTWKLALRFTAIAIIFVSTACSTFENTVLKELASNKMEVFNSKQELEEYAQRINALSDYRRVKEIEYFGSDYDEEVERIEVTGSRLDDSQNSITNNQVAGVDEGDIIKITGDYLLILRQGKIYSVRISENGENILRVISEVEVSQPNWSKDVWYDELLVINSTLLVLGFDYDLGASKIIRFKLNDTGDISYLDGIVIRSNDYFNDVNYASRAFQGEYLTYLPIELIGTGDSAGNQITIPQYAELGVNNQPLIWKDLLEPRDIYKPSQVVVEPILHTLIRCRPLQEKFECGATALVSSDNYEYFVSESAFYLWTYALPYELTTDFNFDELWNPHYEQPNLSNKDDQSTLFKIEHSSSQVTSIRVEGMPIDQFSFQEREDEVFVVAASNPYSQEKTDVRLFNIENSDFGTSGLDEANQVSSWVSSTGATNNRFSNNWLSLGYFSYISGGYFDKKATIKPEFELTLKSLTTLENVVIDLEHSADRIEPIGSKLFVSGIDKNFDFNVSIINLSDTPYVESQGVFGDFLEEESRSHAFNFSQAHEPVNIAGITAYNKSESSGNSSLNDFYWENTVSSNIVFFGLTENLEVWLAGEIQSSAKPLPGSDDCELSCFDWYGNSRPFFIGKRIFALSGDELAEAELIADKVVETQRVNIKIQKN